MKIRQNTPEYLIIEYVPWRLLAFLLVFLMIWVAGSVGFILQGEPAGAVIFLTIGAGLPAAAIWYLAQRDQWLFDRASQTFEHRRRNFRGYSRIYVPLTTIEEVYVGQYGSNHGRLFIHITGDMDAGHHVFTPTTQPLAKVSKTSDMIRDWLAA